MTREMWEERIKVLINNENLSRGLIDRLKNFFEVFVEKGTLKTLILDIILV
jgi:hypothetical protein